MPYLCSSSLTGTISVIDPNSSPKTTESASTNTVLSCADTSSRGDPYTNSSSSTPSSSVSDVSWSKMLESIPASKSDISN